MPLQIVLPFHKGIKGIEYPIEPKKRGSKRWSKRGVMYVVNVVVSGVMGVVERASCAQAGRDGPTSQTSIEWCSMSARVVVVFVVCGVEGDKGRLSR